MLARFKAAVPDDPKVALGRADELLRDYGFKVHEQGYHRASWLGPAGLIPRQVDARIFLTFEGQEVQAVLHTSAMRGAVSALDRHVWLGEMEDLKAALEGVAGPGLDRARENLAAGVLTGITAATAFGLMALTSIIHAYGPYPLAIAAVLPLLVYVLVPFRMPRYALKVVPSNLSNDPR